MHATKVTHHGSNEGEEGCATVRLLESLPTSPGIEMLLLSPDGERNVVSKGVGVSERIDAFQRRNEVKMV